MRLMDIFGSLLPVLILAGSAAILLSLFGGMMDSSGPPVPVAKRFMTRREQAMRAAIEQILPMYRVHAQVAMGALLKVPSRPGRRSTPAARNAFAQKIVDFVVENPATGEVVALIEIDDGSHRADKDRRRDEMTAAAGYRTLRVPASATPELPDVVKIVGVLREETK